MKIKLAKHNIKWKQSFTILKAELIEILGFVNPQIEHIGSTAIDGLSAKPIIDVLIGLDNDNLLNEVINPLVEKNFIYYEVYNHLMPYRRFFVKHKKDLNIPKVIREEEHIPRSTEEHNARLAHIHILKYKSEHWIRHIAFRNYLQEHPQLKEEYQQLKETLSPKDWADGNDYNKAKDIFIKVQEQKAIRWYNRTTNR
jgi:GrpB-like predicted nucleotidyltransferase (UPF0157 family)